jgi:hypothetical protein
MSHYPFLPQQGLWASGLLLLALAVYPVPGKTPQPIAKDRVLRVQRWLQELGVYKGALDGKENHLLIKSLRAIRKPRERLKEQGAFSQRFLRRLKALVIQRKRILKAQKLLRDLRVYDGPLDGNWNPRFTQKIQALQARKEYLRVGKQISRRLLRLLENEKVLHQGGLIFIDKPYFFALLQVHSIEELIQSYFSPGTAIETGVVPLYTRFNTLEIDPHHADFCALMSYLGLTAYHVEDGSGERGYYPTQNSETSIQKTFESAYKTALYSVTPMEKAKSQIEFQLIRNRSYR